MNQFQKLLFVVDFEAMQVSSAINPSSFTKQSKMAYWNIFRLV